LAPRACMTPAELKLAGMARTMPNKPTQNDWVKTRLCIRQVGIPRASNTANSRSEAAVAADKVWLVTAAPTISPNRAAQPRATPAFVLSNQCSRERSENSARLNADIFPYARRRSTTAETSAGFGQRASKKVA